MSVREARLNPDTEKYIELFYEPKLSAYSLLKSFFAKLYKDGKREISRDLVSFFYEMKKQPKFQEILHEIKFRSNGIFYYSNELEDNIFFFFFMGLLGKENPSFGVILLKYNDDVAEEALDNTPKEYLDLIEELANRYIADNTTSL